MYKDGITNGKMVDFYLGSKVKRNGNFSVNVAFGQQVEYFENGTIIEEKKDPTEFDKMMVRKFR